MSSVDFEHELKYDECDYDSPENDEKEEKRL